MKTILLAAAFAALPGFAIGQTITQTLNFSGIPDFSAPLLFNKYDGPAANLLNVNVSYSITVQGGQFIVDNDADTPANVTANFGAGLDTTNSPDVHLLDASFNQIINGVAVTNSATFNLAANVGDGLNDYDSSGPDGAILVGTTKNTTGGADVNAAFRNEFVGPGQFTITAIAKQIGSLSYNSGIETATTPVNAFGTITVTYNVIPEPGSTMLVGLAAVGLAFRRRRA